MKIIIRRALFLSFIVLVVSLIFFRRNNIDERYEPINTLSFVRGVDVSRYQGNIDFEKLYEQNIRFAFIKFTEGRDYIDPMFWSYWNDAKLANIKRGAYHFYRFEVTGEEQAKNFISNLEVLEDEDLPPALDVEYYGQYINRPAPKDEVKKEIRVMVDMLEDHYGKKPIIYCNKYIYDRYLSSDFEDVDIWFRYIGQGIPELPGNREWTFWQFDDEAKLEGYGGPGANEFIDLNYFYGDMEELENYGRKQEN